MAARYHPVMIDPYDDYSPYFPEIGGLYDVFLPGDDVPRRVAVWNYYASAELGLHFHEEGVACPQSTRIKGALWRRVK